MQKTGDEERMRDETTKVETNLFCNVDGFVQCFINIILYRTVLYNDNHESSRQYMIFNSRIDYFYTVNWMTNFSSTPHIFDDSFAYLEV